MSHGVSWAMASVCVLLLFCIHNGNFIHGHKVAVCEYKKSFLTDRFNFLIPLLFSYLFLMHWKYKKNCLWEEVLYAPYSKGYGPACKHKKQQPTWSCVSSLSLYVWAAVADGIDREYVKVVQRRNYSKSIHNITRRLLLCGRLNTQNYILYLFSYRGFNFLLLLVLLPHKSLKQ